MHKLLIYDVLGCVPLEWSEKGSLTPGHLNHSAFNKGIDESTLGKDFSVPLVHHDASNLGYSDPFSDHPKGTHP